MNGERLRRINYQLLLMFCILKETEICPTYISNNNSNREKQIIHLMILNEKKEDWHYLAVKKHLHY